MERMNAWVAGGLGVVVGAVSARYLPPAAGIAAGALVVVVAMQLVGEWPRYALAGTVYALGLGLAVAVPGPPAGPYVRTPLLALLGFGAVSGGIVAVRSAGRRSVRRLAARTGDEEYAEEVYAAVSAGAGTMGMAWTVVTAKEKAARYTGIAGVGTVSFLLNVAGVRLPVPFWRFAGGIDVNVLVFVGCVVSGFHALSTVSATWRAAKSTASKGTDAGSRAAGAAASTAGSAAAGAADAAWGAVDRTAGATGTAKETASGAAETAAGAASEAAESAADVASEAGSRAAETASGVVDGATDAPGRASEATGTATGAALGAAERASGASSEATERASKGTERASKGTERASDAAGTASEAATGAASEVAGRATDAAAGTRSRLARLKERLLGDDS